MLTACNGVLANGLGNLAQRLLQKRNTVFAFVYYSIQNVRRSLSLVFKNCNKTIPSPPTEANLTEKDKELLKAAGSLLATSEEIMAGNQLHR